MLHLDVDLEVMAHRGLVVAQMAHSDVLFLRMHALDVSREAGLARVAEGAHMAQVVLRLLMHVQNVLAQCFESLQIRNKNCEFIFVKMQH